MRVNECEKKKTAKKKNTQKKNTKNKNNKKKKKKKKKNSYLIPESELVLNVIVTYIISRFRIISISKSICTK